VTKEFDIIKRNHFRSISCSKQWHNQDFAKEGGLAISLRMARADGYLWVIALLRFMKMCVNINLSLI